MSDLIKSFMKIMEAKPENMFEAAKRKCPKCGKLLSECTCSPVKEGVEDSPADKKADKAGEKKYGMTHKEWEKSSMDKKADKKLAKEDLDEAKAGGAGYELYHDSYSGAVQHALDHHHATKSISVSSDDHWHHIGSGPRKPSAGETVVHNIPAQDHNGNHHVVHMQIHNRGGDTKPYELNTYSSKIPNKKMHESIEIKPSHKGLFTKKANAAGESVSKYAEQEKFAGGKLGKEANFALNAKKWHHEEVEPIDEISSDTLYSYRRKAMNSADSSYKQAMSPDNMARKDSDVPRKAFTKRADGIKTADSKLSGTAKVNATEEVEVIDELTHKTTAHRYAQFMKKKKFDSYVSTGKMEPEKKDKKIKLAKEEVEVIDERNKENKAKKDAVIDPKKRPEKKNTFDPRNLRKEEAEIEFSPEELAHFAAIMKD